ncbi:MAG: Rab family GTPase [Thermoplasmata archaeon]
MAKKSAEKAKMKLCLAGEAAVGKTSLIRRFVYDQFEDKYTVTLGAKVTKKTVTVNNPRGKGKIEVDVAIWDIMGEKFLRELLREAYFYGAQGILAVCDVTRAETLVDLEDWKVAIEKVVGEIPILILANKVDLKDEAVIDEKGLQLFCEGWQCPYLFTSAKSGKNVDKAFSEMAKMVLEGLLVEAKSG